MTTVLTHNISFVEDCNSVEMHGGFTCGHLVMIAQIGYFSVYAVVQFSLWFTFYFLLFLVMVMYDNEFETKENKI